LQNDSDCKPTLSDRGRQVTEYFFVPLVPLGSCAFCFLGVSAVFVLKKNYNRAGKEVEINYDDGTGVDMNLICR
jgi:hypothetical protein